MSAEFFCKTPKNKFYDGHYAANLYQPHDEHMARETYLEKVADLPDGAIYREIGDQANCNVGVPTATTPPPKKHYGNWNWLWLLIGLGLIGWCLWWLLNKDKMTKNDKGKIIVAVDSSNTPNNTNNIMNNNPNGNANSILNQLRLLRNNMNGATANNSNMNGSPNANDNGAGLGNLTKAVVTIDHIQALPNAPGKSWVPISNTSQNVNLLDLKNSAQPHSPIVIADTMIPIGQYQKLKFHISKISVDDSLGGKTVYPAGNNVEFDAPFKVDKSTANGYGYGYGYGKDSSNANATVIVLDIPLNDSLRDATDENNRAVRVFAPSINYEIRGDAQALTANKKLVLNKSGNLLSQGRVGMDVNGNIEKDSGIPPNATLRVEKGKIYLVYPGPLPPLPPFPPQPQPQPQPTPAPMPGPQPQPPLPNPSPSPSPAPVPGPVPTPAPGPMLYNTQNLNSGTSNYQYPPDWVQPQLLPANFSALQQATPFIPSPALLPGNRYNRH